MIAKPALFAAIVVAGLGAAGVGGYLAMRPADVPEAPAAAAASTDSPADAPAQPAGVAETEAVVAEPTPPAAQPAEPVERARPEPVAAPTRRSSSRPAVPAPPPARRTPPADPAPPATVARDEAPRPAPEPVRDPLPPPVEAPREARPVEERAPIVEAPPAPRVQELVVPADSVIGLQLQDSVSSETARLEDRVEARVTRDLRVGSTVVVPAGTRARGEVTIVEAGGKFRERARLGVRFHTLVLADGTTVPIQTETIYREGDEVGRKAATRIGASAVGGAIIGAIFGGGKGAAVGAAAGAGAGTAATMATDRSHARLAAGSTLTVRLTSPVTMTVEE